MGDLEHGAASRRRAVEQQRLAARRPRSPVSSSDTPRQSSRRTSDWSFRREGSLAEPRRRVEHGDERATEPEALAGRQRAAGRAERGQRGHASSARRPRAAVLPELAHAEVAEDGGEPAGVIGVPVRERHHVEARERPVPEERRQHALAHVEARGRRRARRPRAGGGPPGSSMSVASPWPTSRNVTRSMAVVGRPGRARARRRHPRRSPSSARPVRRDAAHDPGAARRRAVPGATAAGPGAGRWTMRGGQGGRQPHRAQQQGEGPREMEESSRATSLSAATSSARAPPWWRRAASGTTRRLATTPISESWLKWRHHERASPRPARPG